jgi:hypothetical protein
MDPFGLFSMLPNFSKYLIAIRRRQNLNKSHRRFSKALMTNLQVMIFIP